MENEPTPDQPNEQGLFGEEPDYKQGKAALEWDKRNKAQVQEEQNQLLKKMMREQGILPEDAEEAEDGD